MIHNYVTHYDRKTLETLTYMETLKSFDISLAKSNFFRFLSQQMNLFSFGYSTSQVSVHF